VSAFVSHSCLAVFEEKVWKNWAANMFD